jgi:hypothetical protein
VGLVCSLGSPIEEYMCHSKAFGEHRDTCSCVPI